MKKLKIGDVVSWRGAWGNEPAIDATVESIQICPAGKKYGREVKSASWNTVKKDRVVVTLDNGHWAYGTQLSAK